MPEFLYYYLKAASLAFKWRFRNKIYIFILNIIIEIILYILIIIYKYLF